MKNEAKKSADYEALCQTVRLCKTLSEERKGQLIHAVYRVPKATRTIEPEEVQEWMELHSHADKYHGCIGGHITKTECYTSIGTMVTYMCGSCREEAYVNEDF